MMHIANPFNLQNDRNPIRYGTQFNSVADTTFHEPEDESFEMEVGSWPLPSGGTCVVDFAPPGTDTRKGYFPDQIKAHFIGSSTPADLIHYFRVICPGIAKVLSESTEGEKK